MRVLLINKSDSTGGAAVVTFRLMEALRSEGIDARMLVVEKLTDSPYVKEAAPHWRARIPFLLERLRVFTQNGFNRDTLFKIDLGSDGLPIHRHPWVKEADIICLNWVNQGMVSLKEVLKLRKMGKRIVWTMHDMWNMTGICHHAGSCDQYTTDLCRRCPLLDVKHAKSRCAIDTLNEKGIAYFDGLFYPDIHFVAVSNWLFDRALHSSLLRPSVNCLHVIPNAFPFPENIKPRTSHKSGDNYTLLFGAARLDDPIKGLPILIAATQALAQKHSDLASRLKIKTFGNVKFHESLTGFGIEHEHLGMIRGADALREVYESGDILLSTSLYETLPGTLVEAQAYGCVPVAFDSGGQRDIIDNGRTGVLIPFRNGLRGRVNLEDVSQEDIRQAGEDFAEAIVMAITLLESDKDIIDRMSASAINKFSSRTVAQKYIGLFSHMMKHPSYYKRLANYHNEFFAQKENYKS